MEKDLEREHDEARTDRAAFVSAKANVCRLSSEIDGVRERSEGSEFDWKDAVDRGLGGKGKGPEDWG